MVEVVVRGWHRCSTSILIPEGELKLPVRRVPAKSDDPVCIDGGIRIGARDRRMASADSIDLANRIIAQARVMN